MTTNTNTQTTIVPAIIAIVVLLTLVCTADAADFPAGNSPLGLATGDFNNDFHVDLVVCNANSEVSLLLGDGTGGFAAPVAIDFGGTYSMYVTACDMDNDGNMDIIVSDHPEGVAGGVNVLLGRGDGTFRNAHVYACGVGPMQAQVGDFNDDDYLDIVCPAYDDADVWVYLNNGHGGLDGGVAYTMGDGSYTCDMAAVGDFDLDGVVTFIVHVQEPLVPYGGGYAWFINDGEGEFAMHDRGVFEHNRAPTYGVWVQEVIPLFYPQGELCYGWECEGEPCLDVVQGYSQDPGIQVHYGECGMPYNDWWSWDIVSHQDVSRDMAFCDADTDGWIDAVLPETHSTGVLVMLNRGTGEFGWTFDMRAMYDVGSHHFQIEVSDFNEDGLDDAVVGNSIFNSVSVLLGPLSRDRRDGFCDDFSGAGIDAVRWREYGEGASDAGDSLELTTSSRWDDGLEAYLRQTYTAHCGLGRPSSGEPIVISGRHMMPEDPTSYQSAVSIGKSWGSDQDRYELASLRNHGSLGDNRVEFRCFVGGAVVEDLTIGAFVPGEWIGWRVDVLQSGCEVYLDDGAGWQLAHTSTEGTFAVGVMLHGGGIDEGVSYWDDICVNTDPIPPPVSGATSTESGPVGGVTVDLSDDTGTLLDTQITDVEDGTYGFEVGPGDYVVEVVPPLDYVPAGGGPSSVPVTVAVEQTVTVDFPLEQVVAVAEARAMSFWRHQYKVHDTGHGNPKESLQALEEYRQEVFDHFYGRTDEYAIRLEGVTYSAGPQPLTFGDALATLSVRGNVPMADKAHAHYLALLLNTVSGKVGTYTAATENGATVSQVITYVGDLLEDDDPANDELAKDLAEYVNENQLIPTGLVPLWTPNVAFVGPRRPLVSFALPNPARGMTRITYGTDHAVGPARLDIYDVAGRRVRTLTAEHDPGSQSRGIVWRGVDDSGRPVAAGIYFYTLTVGGMQSDGKVVLMK